jgi:hypothetical protein
MAIETLKGRERKARKTFSEMIDEVISPNAINSATLVVRTVDQTAVKPTDLNQSQST